MPNTMRAMPPPRNEIYLKPFEMSGKEGGAATGEEASAEGEEAGSETTEEADTENWDGDHNERDDGNHSSSGKAESQAGKRAKRGEENSYGEEDAGNVVGPRVTAAQCADGG